MTPSPDRPADADRTPVAGEPRSSPGRARSEGIPKLPTGIDGLDHLCDGGLPAHRSTLVAGSAGSAKTLLAVQFLAEGVARGEPGVFVTFEDRPADIASNVASMGWDIGAWQREGKWAFVDASPRDDSELVIGSYDLTALLSRTRAAVAETGAGRLAFDSLGGLIARFGDVDTVRREMLRITSSLDRSGVTSLITAERVDEYGAVGRFGVEEFIADNVILLRNALENGGRRRTVEVLKFRGTTHRKGEYPFTIQPGRGIVAIPISGVALTQPSTSVRISSGIPAMDQMCSGGLFRDSIMLVSGATGTGKTLMTTHFVAGGARAGERSLVFAFEESRDQLIRNAMGWGMDFPAMEERGLLKLSCVYPEAASLEDHLVRMRTEIDEFQPQRIAVDSISALERMATPKAFREFVIGLSSHLKVRQLAAVFTATTSSLMGSASVTERHISTLTDAIVLLRYVELYGSMRRGLTVLKMRGANHDKDIREYTIDADGMHIGKPFRNVVGILAGNPAEIALERELQSLDNLLPEDRRGGGPTGH